MCIFNFHRQKSWIPLVLISTLPLATAYAQPYAYVSNLSGNSLSVVNTANNTIAATISVAASPSGLAVTPDGGSVYVASRGNNTVSVISTASNSIITSIGVGSTPIQLAISPNGAQVYVVAQGSNQVNVIDTASKSVTANINVGAHPNAVAFSPDGTRAYVTNLYGGNVSIIDTNSKSVIGNFATASGPSGVAVIPNGRVYVGNQYANTVTVHDPAGNLLATIGGFSFPNWLASTPNGSRVFVTNGNSASVSTIDPNSNSIVATIPVGSNPTSVAVSADGANAYVTNEFAFSLSQVNVSGNFVTNTLAHVGVYPIAVAMQPPASGGPACTYSISPSSASFGATGGSGSVNVSAPAGCSWGAASNAGWAQITGGASGSGNGSVSYSVNANLGVSGLSGTLTIAGQTFTITEAGAVCSFSLSALSASLGAGAGGGSVNILTTAGCNWSATSDSTNWLNVTGGSSGNASATVSFSVTANPATAARTGHLTIGGLSFTVTQAGTAFTGIRVHCGGGQLIDGGGNVWSPDNALNFNVTSSAIGNTSMPALYQTEAWSTGTLQYQFAVPNGSFTVKLRFAEFYMTQRGQRTFNIVINGVTYYSSFDILASVAPNTADDVSIPVVVGNGQITIQIVPVIGPAKINAIEIF
ncbi:MAG TPA: malectin domain-containing carbohydrate-binding protein [Bryobacteraceae bacterium]